MTRSLFRVLAAAAAASLVACSQQPADEANSDDIIGGVIKPLVFAFLMGTIACHKGLKTEGGTVGVGRSTTSAVVTASIIVIVTDFFLAKALQIILGTTT